MRKINSLALSIAGLILAQSSFAQDVKHMTTKLTQQEFPVAAGTCGLKKASLIDFHDLMIAGKQYPGAYYTTHSAAVVLETSDPSCTGKYAVVQYVKGCAYHMSQNKKTKVIERYFETVRQLRDESSGVVFPDWTVDSAYISPMYNVVNQKDVYADRSVLDYRIPKKPMALDSQSTPASLDAYYEMLFTASNLNTPLSSSLRETPNPTSTQTFASGLTEGSAYYPNGIKVGDRDMWIPSLQYMSCVYQVKDIPSNGDPARFDVPADQGGPLYCFNWKDNLTFNLTTLKFEDSNTIDAYCSSEDAKAEIQAYKKDVAASSIWNFPTEK